MASGRALSYAFEPTARVASNQAARSRELTETTRAVVPSRTSTFTPRLRQYPATAATRCSSFVGWKDQHSRRRRPSEIGRAHVGTPVPHAHLVCRLLLVT